MSVDAVLWWARHGKLAGEKVDGQWLLDVDDVRRIAAERDTAGQAWVSYTQAAQILGVTAGVIHSLIERGDLTSRSQGRRWVRALNRAEVEDLAARRRAEQGARAKAAAVRQAELEQQRRPEPIDGDPWLDVLAAAAVLRISRSRVQQLVSKDRIPHLRRGRRIWFRRSHMEQLAAARAAAATRQP